MKQMRFSPWLILVLAVVLVFAAGCDRPDPQLPINTPQPMNVPQQPAVSQSVATAVPGGDTSLPPDGAATPTLPAVIAATPSDGGAVPAATPVPGGQDPTQPLVPTVPPPQPTPAPVAQQTPQVQPTAAVNAQGNIVHTVKTGETLFSIGRLYNVNPYAIAAANNIPYPYVIYPGQQLTIPTGATPPGPTPPPPSGQCRYRHTVRPGDNLFRISLAYGVPMTAIASANGIVNYNLIFAGQTLCIP
jgi:N-acetylmuramoyl-L-alanine amidase